MILLKYIEFFAICVFSLNAYAHAQYASINQIEDVRIAITNDGRWFCDMIECPGGTYRCVVTKSNETPSILTRQNFCISATGVTLASSTSTSPTNPNNIIRLNITSYNNGYFTINTNNASGNFDSAKFQKDMQQFNSHLNLAMQNLNNNLANMRYNLQHMFDRPFYNQFQY